VAPDPVKLVAWLTGGRVVTTVVGGRVVVLVAVMVAVEVEVILVVCVAVTVAIELVVLVMVAVAVAVMVVGVDLQPVTRMTVTSVNPIIAGIKFLKNLLNFFDLLFLLLVSSFFMC
jgi:hypothetical protein